MIAGAEFGERVTDAEIEKLLTSGIFDPFWYDEQYPDVRRSGLCPASHYLLIGRRLGRLGKKPAPDLAFPTDDAVA
ncbi:hypothetical protein [Sphingomonas sp. LY160]|uniref:hypothetical protein n=1 Tax=Sphingomonas sp. LY160 TaxID=3095342 RepID=UPI002ADEC03F|nr:hypothetical protein [Sphingomonas sp. LY160]MEA1071994.1 hypothetical protein [Sphingomonas sp. LY160]